MALSLFTDIPDTCYTSQLQKIEIETDAETVSLTITHQASNYRGLQSSLTALEGGGNAATLTDAVRLSSQAVSDDGNGQTQIFQSEYATYNGFLTIYDLGSFLETFMADMNGLQRFIFQFSTESEIINRVFAVIYCKRQPIMTAEDLANSNFITNYFTRLVYRGAHDRLPYFAGFGLPGGYTSYTLHYTVLYRTPSGTTGTYAFDHYGRASYGVSYLNTSPENLRIMCIPSIPNGSEILAYTLQQGDRVARFFVTEQTVVRPHE